MYDIDIKNYQIISHIHLQLKPGLTILSGPSNNGKSSIIKAIKQAIYNTSGTNFIKQGESNCTITISTPDNHTFIYHKDNTSSRSYIQIDNNAKIHKLGSSQLLEVRDLFHMDSSLNYNFWDQLTKPFLIGLSHSQQFNSLNTSTLTSHLANIHQQIKEDSQFQRDNSNQLQGQLNQLQLNQTNITNSLELLNTSALPNLITISPNITSAYNLLSDYIKQLTDLTNLNNILTSYSIPESITPPKEDFSTLKSQLVLFGEITKLDGYIVSAKLTSENLHKLVTSYNELLNHFDTCPLCHRPLHNHTDERID